MIADIAFGKPFGNLEADSDVSSYLKIEEDTLPLLILLGTFPGLAKVLFSRIFSRFMPKDTDSVGLGRLMGYVLLHTFGLHLSDGTRGFRIAKEAVEERFDVNGVEEKRTRRDMLGSFLRHGLTEREARTELVLQMCVFLILHYTIYVMEADGT